MLARQEVVIAEGPEGGKIQEHDAAGGEHLAEDPPTAPVVAEPGDRECRADHHADGHAAGLADPAVLEDLLEEEGGGEEQEHHRHPAQAAAADPRFETRPHALARLGRSGDDGRPAALAGCHRGRKNRFRRGRLNGDRRFDGAAGAADRDCSSRFLQLAELFAEA